MKEKILIIDDNGTDQKLMKMYLKDFKCEIISVDTGEEGLEKLASEKMGLVILDTLLPHQDGFEICKQIKTSFPQVPVILITGQIDAVDAERAASVHADDYIMKTSNPEPLVNAVKKVLR